VARNIEIKARIADASQCRERIATLVSQPPQVLHQKDTFFAVSRGRLKMRQFSDHSGELIFYERSNQVGPKESTYSIVRCNAPEELAALLKQALGIRGIVEKRREVSLAGRSRLHLDEVHGLGSFLEIEVVMQDDEATSVGEQEAHNLLKALEIPLSALVECAYIDLLEVACPTTARNDEPLRHDGTMEDHNGTTTRR